MSPRKAGFFSKRRNNVKKVYCPICRRSRRLNFRKGVTALVWIQAVVLSALATLVFFQEFSWKFLPIFATILIFAEFLSFVFRRNSLICPYCGFDPVYAKKKRKLAIERIKTFQGSKKPIELFDYSGDVSNVPVSATVEDSVISKDLEPEADGATPEKVSFSNEALASQAAAVADSIN